MSATQEVPAPVAAWKTIFTTSMHPVAITGVVGAVALAAGLGALGDTPDPHDPSVSTATYFTEHRDAVFTSTSLVTFGVATLIVFVVAVRRGLTMRSPLISADAAATGGLFLLAVLLLNQIVYAALAWDLGASGADTARSLFVFTVMTSVVQGPMCALLLGGVALSRAPGLPRWYRAMSGLGATAAALSIVAYGDEGWLFADVQQQVVLQIFVLWTLVTAVVLSRAGVRRSATSR